jgi:hypothetical protein
LDRRRETKKGVVYKLIKGARILDHDIEIKLRDIF